MTIAPAVLSVVLAVAVGWAVPGAIMRAVVPALEPSALRRPNYRGREIVPSLGLVWVIWAVSLVALQAVFDLLVGLSDSTTGFGELLQRFWTTPLALPFFVVPFMLVTGCAALGLADDAFGRAEGKGTAAGPRGFRGHLRALSRGSVTTGMLKMLGIGALAFFYGVSAAEGILGRSALPEGWSGSGTALAGATVLATLVIALSANLINLLDLRPGRALKTYLILVPGPAVALALSAVASYNEQMTAFASEVGGIPLAPWEGAAAALALVMVLAGPALAVWRLDLGERAMLGDAGSNAMGAIVGYLLTAALSLQGLAIAAAALLVLNLLSEKVSFSAVIDRTQPLRWLDGLGRVAGSDADEPAPKDTAVTTPNTVRPSAPSVRYDSDVGDDGED